MMKYGTCIPELTSTVSEEVAAIIAGSIVGKTEGTSNNVESVISCSLVFE